jgi:hypothetical protein
MDCVPSNITLEGFLDLAQTCDNPQYVHHAHTFCAARGSIALCLSGSFPFDLPQKLCVLLLLCLLTNDSLFSWAPQSRRMEAKYWPYINFVGHMETVAADAERLLRHVGGDECWERFGATGWGNDNNNNCKDCSAIFQRGPPPTLNGTKNHASTTIVGAHHATAAHARLKAYYTPELERKVDEFCFGDYHVAALNLTRSRLF